jgi:hypothetical protein
MGRTGAIVMHAKTLLPLTALIALVSAAPLSWAQESHDTATGPSAGEDANAALAPAPAAQEAPGNTALAMAAGQPQSICNPRGNTVACGAKAIPHEPGARPVNPASQAPAPKQ